MQPACITTMTLEAKIEYLIKALESVPFMWTGQEPKEEIIKRISEWYDNYGRYAFGISQTIPLNSEAYASLWTKG